MSSDEKRPLGKILLQRKLVSQQELDQALRAQKRSKTPVPLASQLVDEGTVKEVDALRALSEQHGVPGIDLTQIVILLEHLALVPRELAETNLILPVLVRGDRVFLATANPDEKRVVDELEFVTGKKVYSYIAVHSTLIKAIAAAYDAKARGERHYFGPCVPGETLRALGLSGLPTPAVADDFGAPTDRLAQRPPAPSEPERGPEPMGHEPIDDLSAPELVVDDAMVAASRDYEISTTEFGNVDDEVSKVAALPEQPRARALATAGAQGEPAPSTSGAGGATGASRDAAATGRLVLVVDDEEEIRTLLRRVLTQQGHRVIEADRGLLALRMVKDHLPDLIILDAMLPELHGFDIARRMKGSAKYGRIPIIMVSAVYRGWRIAADLKQNYGVEEYLEKPFKIAAIVDAVNRRLPSGDGAPSESNDPEHLSSEAESALRQGIFAYKDGGIDEAVDHLKRGIGIDPLSYRLHFHLALLLGKRGQVYEAIQELERAIELHPKHYAALKNLAVLYEKAGFKNKAIEVWERCIAVAPDEPTRATVKDHLRQLI